MIEVTIVEMEGDDLDALLLYDPDGEDGIQPAGEHADDFVFFVSQYFSRSMCEWLF